MQEKLDGSCCLVERTGDTLIARTRAGYPAADSRFTQHRLFHHWVTYHSARFLALLPEGETAAGEWLAQVHGTRYRLTHEPFVLFDVLRPASQRMPTAELMASAHTLGFHTPRLVYRGPPTAIQPLLAKREPSGHGAIDLVEGLVFRAEKTTTRSGVRHCDLMFLAKWVRADMVPGRYLPMVSGLGDIWNETEGGSVLDALTGIIPEYVLCQARGRAMSAKDHEDFEQVFAHGVRTLRASGNWRRKKTQSP